MSEPEPIQFQFSSASTVPRITNLGIVGVGDVVVKKIWPAAQACARLFHRVAVCSVQAASPLRGAAHSYYRVEDSNLLPFDLLYRDGFLGPDTLWVIATPSQFHVAYALQLLGWGGRVAIEKPVAFTASQAKVLRPYVHKGYPVYPVDHKIFNASALACIDLCREDPSRIARVRRIEGMFYEAAGFAKGRAQENCFADIQWHLLTIMIGVLKTLGEGLGIVIHSCRAAQHQPDPSTRFADAVVSTATRLSGAVLTRDGAIPFDLMQAKGTLTTAKRMSFRDEDSKVTMEIDLDESGWHAHKRVLQALARPDVDMRHTLEDAITFVDLLERAAAGAIEEEQYPFGSLPSFLVNPLPAELKLPAA